MGCVKSITTIMSTGRKLPEVSECHALDRSPSQRLLLGAEESSEASASETQGVHGYIAAVQVWLYRRPQGVGI